MTLQILERFHIVLTFILLIWALVLIYRVNSHMKEIEKKNKRHDNVQSVILEQVDEIREKIG